MTTPEQKLASFFALPDKRQRDNLAKQAAERKDREDKKLARVKP